MTPMTQPAILPSLTVSRILHAGYVFECDGTRIAFDTIFENPFSRNCHAFPAVRFDTGAIRRTRFDAVFISHFHDDHCSLESLDLLDRATPIYLYCLFEELFEMVRALGFSEVHALRLNTAVTVGAFVVTPREAMDADVDSMFQVQAGGLNVLNVVDSWIDDTTLAQLVAAGPWDMVLWPFQTMREIEVLAPSRAPAAAPALPDEWIAQLQALAPRFVVPSSCQFEAEPWSWYQRAFFPISYAMFAAEVGAALPDARVVRMDPSVSFRLDATTLQPAPALPWVIPVGEQQVDYAYQGHAEAPSTASIARHFPALSAAQQARVDDYCRMQLPAQYGAVEAGCDYFDVARVWQLSVFDHLGQARRWRYLLSNDGATLLDAVEDDSKDGVDSGVDSSVDSSVDSAAAPLAWHTEIAGARLYAALEAGESLTSMYLRINDTVFAAAIERALAEVDVVDDPLIRCLFGATFGAYQAAQLRRLLARAERAERAV